jgi:hypothetical protein
MTNQSIRFQRYVEYKWDFEKINNTVIKQSKNDVLTEIRYRDFDLIVFSKNNPISPMETMRIGFRSGNDSYYFECEDEIIDGFLRMVLQSVFEKYNLNISKIFFFQTEQWFESMFYVFFCHSEKGIMTFKVQTLDEKKLREYLKSYYDKGPNYAALAYNDFFKLNLTLKSKNIDDLFQKSNTSLLIHSKDYYRDYLSEQSLKNQKETNFLLKILIFLSLVAIISVARVFVSPG